MIWGILIILAVLFLVFYFRDRANFWNSYASILEYEDTMDKAEADYFDWLNNRGIYANGKGKPPDCKVCGK